MVKSGKGEDDGESGGFDLKKLAIMFGLGTAGLGFLIDKTTSDEDVRIDRNLINQAKQVDASFANILEPATTDLSYASALTPYPHADGGIIGYQEGGDVEKGMIRRIWDKMFAKKEEGERESSVLGSGLIDKAARELAEDKLKKMEYYRDELGIEPDIEEYKKQLDRN